MWPFKKRYKKTKTNHYGNDKTIHQNTLLDIETNSKGEVVSVWFRCHPVPYKQVVVNELRSNEMKGMYSRSPMPGVLSIEFDEEGVK